MITQEKTGQRFHSNPRALNHQQMFMAHSRSWLLLNSPICVQWTPTIQLTFLVESSRLHIYSITMYLSGSLSHHQLHSPDLTHLITDHLHLSPVIKSTISTHFSRTVTVWSVLTFRVDSPDPLTFLLQYRRYCVPLPNLHRSCAPPSPSSIAPAGSYGKIKLTGLTALLHFLAIVQ